MPKASLVMPSLLMASSLRPKLMRHSQNEQHQFMAISDSGTLKSSTEVASHGRMFQARLGDDFPIALIAKYQFHQLFHSRAKIERLRDSIPKFGREWQRWKIASGHSRSPK
jgi:hypothetical protein